MIRDFDKVFKINYFIDTSETDIVSVDHMSMREAIERFKIKIKDHSAFLECNNKNQPYSVCNDKNVIGYITNIDQSSIYFKIFGIDITFFRNAYDDVMRVEKDALIRGVYDEESKVINHINIISFMLNI